MTTPSLITLANEADTALTLLAEAFGQTSADSITGISECNRRATSALADFHAQQFRVFLPPLPRAAATNLAEALHALTGAIFCTALLLPRRPFANEHHRNELQGLSLMNRYLCEAVATLPRAAKGKTLPAPDTFRFYAELNKVRAAHALSLLHGERTLQDRAMGESMTEICRALREAWRAMLVLMMECV